MNEAEVFEDLGVFDRLAGFFKPPGWKFRPTGIEVLRIGKLSKSEVDILQQGQEKIRAALEGMPGGVPRSKDDLRAVLPHINPLAYDRNCSECSLAVDDALAGRASVAGNSKSKGSLPGRLGSGSITLTSEVTPASIEQELRQPGDRGIVLMGNEDGQGHAVNVVNLEGKPYWIDGQLSGQLSKEAGEPISAIFDRYPYNGSISELLNSDWQYFGFIRTDGR